MNNEPLQLPHLVLTPTIVRGNFAVGEVALPAGVASQVSDYDPFSINSHYHVWDLSSVVEYASAYINLGQLANGMNRFMVMNQFDGDRNHNRFRFIMAEAEHKGIPFAKFMDAELSFADIFPRAVFEKTLEFATSATVDRRGRINIGALRRIFRLSDAEITQFTIAVGNALSQNPGRRLNMAPALARFREALVTAYNAAPAVVDWWIVTDPSRQYTVSLNPRIESPAEWYGAAFTEEPLSPSADEFVEALLATLEGRQAGTDSRPIYDGVCPLCLDPLTRGSANSAILPCGHIFHWSETNEGCSGITGWVTDHNTCPTCRQPFNADDENDMPRRRVAIPVDIEW